MISVTGEAPGRRGRLAGVHEWVVRHDESRLFVVAYVGLAVVLSIWIGLFWLVAVVAVHLAFEVVRQRTRHASWRGVVAEALWELKLDLALVLFALVISLYMEVVLGVVGLQAAARAGAAAQAGLRGGARFAGWQRILRGILLSVDDAAQVARFAAARGRAGTPAEEEAAAGGDAETYPWGPWGAPWGRADRIALGLGAVCVLLLAAAPLLTHHTFGSALATLAAELYPFPADPGVEALAAE
jgi:hypothetical protein